MVELYRKNTPNNLKFRVTGNEVSLYKTKTFESSSMVEFTIFPSTYQESAKQNRSLVFWFFIEQSKEALDNI